MLAKEPIYMYTFCGQLKATVIGVTWQGGYEVRPCRVVVNNYIVTSYTIVIITTNNITKECVKAKSIVM